MDEMKEQGLVTREEAAGLFCNIPTLLDVHSNMLNVLVLTLTPLLDLLSLVRCLLCSLSRWLTQCAPR
jgi:hypothetical protein